MNRRSRWAVMALGLLIAGGCIYLRSLGDLSRDIPGFLAVYGAMFASYVASVVLLRRIRGGRGFLVGYIFLLALLCRLINIGAEPSLSNDIYRYLWEGRAVAAGYNPFSLPPEASELAFLRDGNYAPVNHKHLETIYPPLAQAVFFVGAALEPTIIVQKLLFTLCDLATMAILLVLLTVRGVNPCLVAVYGWSPLVITEFSHSGHVDSLGVLFLMLGILSFQVGRRFYGTVALGFSFLAKYLAVLLVPFFLLKKREFRWVGLFVLIVISGYLPFADASGKVVSSLKTYVIHWHFNSPLFTALEALFGNSMLIRMVLLALIVLFALVQGYRQRDIVRYAFLVIGCSLLLAPTVYPWYLCWIVPFLCFYPSRAWILYTGLVAISYVVWRGFHETGAWELGAGMLLVEYAPFYALLAYEGYRVCGRREAGAA